MVDESIHKFPIVFVTKYMGLTLVNNGLVTNLPLAQIAQKLCEIFF